MAALHRAVALAQVHGVAVCIGQHLHLDVPRLHEKLFQIDLVVAEGHGRLAARCVEALFQLVGRMHLAHALAAAAGACLHEHGISHFLGKGAGLFHRLHRPVAAGHRGHAQFAHGLLGGGLIAQRIDAVRRRSYEHNVVVRARAREIGVFRQKAIARVDGLGACRLGGRDDVGHAQVAFRRRSRPYAHALVGLAHRPRLGVGGRVDGHRLHPQLASRANHAQGYLAAVCNEYLVEHGRAPTRRWARRRT